MPQSSGAVHPFSADLTVPSATTGRSVPVETPMIVVDKHWSDIAVSTSFDRRTAIPYHSFRATSGGCFGREEEDSQAALFSSAVSPGLWYSHCFDRRPSTLVRRCTPLPGGILRCLAFRWIRFFAHKSARKQAHYRRPQIGATWIGCMERCPRTSPDTISLLSILKHIYMYLVNQQVSLTVGNDISEKVFSLPSQYLGIRSSSCSNMSAFTVRGWGSGLRERMYLGRGGRISTRDAQK